MSKDFYSNNHSIQVGVPGSGVEGNLEIKAENNLDIEVENDISLFSTGTTEITGIERVRLYSDDDVIINGDGSVILASGDGRHITVSDQIIMDDTINVEGGINAEDLIYINANSSTGETLFKIDNNGDTQTEFTVHNSGAYTYMVGSLPLEGNKFILASHNKSLFSSSYTIGTDSNGIPCLVLGTTSTITSYIPINIPYRCTAGSFYIAGESTDGSGEFDVTIDVLRVDKTTGVISNVGTNTVTHNYGTGDFIYEDSFLSDPEYRRTVSATYDYEWSVTIVNRSQNSSSFKLRWVKYDWS